MSKKKAAKRNLGLEIYEAFSQGKERIELTVELQDRPWTAVEIEYTHSDGETFLACGFSKVCWPDEWDADEGANRAVMRACARLAQKLTSAKVDFEADVCTTLATQ